MLRDGPLHCGQLNWPRGCSRRPKVRHRGVRRLGLGCHTVDPLNEILRDRCSRRRAGCGDREIGPHDDGHLVRRIVARVRVVAVDQAAVFEEARRGSDDPPAIRVRRVRFGRDDILQALLLADPRPGDLHRPSPRSWWRGRRWSRCLPQPPMPTKGSPRSDHGQQCACLCLGEQVGRQLECRDRPHVVGVHVAVRVRRRDGCVVDRRKRCVGQAERGEEPLLEDLCRGLCSSSSAMRPSRT